MEPQILVLPWLLLCHLYLLGDLLQPQDWQTTEDIKIYTTGHVTYVCVEWYITEDCTTKNQLQPRLKRLQYTSFNFLQHILALYILVQCKNPWPGRDYKLNHHYHYIWSTAVSENLIVGANLLHWKMKTGTPFSAGFLFWCWFCWHLRCDAGNCLWGPLLRSAGWTLRLFLFLHRGCAGFWRRVLICDSCGLGVIINSIINTICDHFFNWCSWAFGSLTRTLDFLCMMNVSSVVSFIFWIWVFFLMCDVFVWCTDWNAKTSIRT